MHVLYRWQSLLPSLFFLFASCLSQDDNLCSKQVPVTTEIDGYRRDYIYYYPSILCDPAQLQTFLLDHTNVGKSDIDFDFSIPDQFSLPLVLTLHGYGDHPVNFENTWKWTSYAEKYGFIVLSPQGGVDNSDRPSWNAQTCCGDNLKNNIDDVGFIRQLIVEFTATTSNLFPFLDLSFDSFDPALTLFITGHSNGGFFSDKLAWTYATGLQKDGQTRFNIPITAVAPCSGYIYNPTEFGYVPETSDTKPDIVTSAHHNVSIFFNHGTGDTFVDPRGCGCDGAKCCCDIDKAAIARMQDDSDTSWCKSVSDEEQRWQEWNKLTTGAEKVDSYVHDQTHATRRCNWGESTGTNSRVLTGVCKWDNGTHHPFSTPFTDFDILRDSIMDFFLHSKCIRDGFVWDADKKSCQAGGSEAGPTNQYYQLTMKTNESLNKSAKVFRTTPLGPYTYQTTPWDILDFYEQGIINNTVNEGEGKTGIAAIHHKIVSHIPKAKIDFLQMTLLLAAYATSLFLIIFACVKTSQLEGEGFCACCCC